MGFSQKRNDSYQFPVEFRGDRQRQYFGSNYLKGRKINIRSKLYYFQDRCNFGGRGFPMALGSCYRNVLKGIQRYQT